MINSNMMTIKTSIEDAHLQSQLIGTDEGIAA